MLIARQFVVKGSWVRIIAIMYAFSRLGPIIAGFLYDLTRSYTIAFGIFALVSLGAVALMFVAKRPQMRN